MKLTQELKVALIHDDLVQWGGAERMLVALCQIFPNAPIYTSVYDSDNKILEYQFKDKKIITSFIQQIPFWKIMYKELLPFYSLAFETFDFSGYDLVISQTTRFAKTIITKPETKHICYLHTPPRFLWDFSGDKIKGLPQLFFSFQRILDQITSSRVDCFVVSSKNAQKRLKKIYHAPSKLIYPFVDSNRFKNMKSFNGGYLLVVSRLNSYKRVDLIIHVANKLNIPLKIVGIGPQEKNLKKIANSNVDFIGSVDEKLLSMLISGCKALVISAEEDFGLMPVEAQIFSKPVIAFKKGGVLETTIEGQTGVFFKEQNPESLTEALVKIDNGVYNGKTYRKITRQFSKEKFINNFKEFINEIID